MMDSSLCCGSEIRMVNADMCRRLSAIEMDYLPRSIRISRLQHITNDEVRQRMTADVILEKIERRSLKWFGHELIMSDDRWSENNLQEGSSREEETRKT